jgi:hypothetical protein
LILARSDQTNSLHRFGNQDDVIVALSLLEGSLVNFLANLEVKSVVGDWSLALLLLNVVVVVNAKQCLLDSAIRSSKS